MAVCLAGLLAYKGAKIGAVVTWEAPKAGGQALKLFFTHKDIKMTQVRHGNDPVTELPPFEFIHMCALANFGHWALDPIECHFLKNIIPPVNAGDLEPAVGQWPNVLGKLPDDVKWMD